jgi:hypothetical protein
MVIAARSDFSDFGAFIASTEDGTWWPSPTAQLSIVRSTRWVSPGWRGFGLALRWASATERTSRGVSCSSRRWPMVGMIHFRIGLAAAL